MNWTEEQIKAAIGVLQQPGRRRVVDCLRDISEATGRNVTDSALRHALAEAGLGNPSSYLSKTPPILPGSGGVFSFEGLADTQGESIEKAYLRKLEREVGRREYLGEKLHDSIIAAFANSPVRLSQSSIPARRSPGRRMITAMLSDIHFGLHVNRREVPGGGYDWQIASRRVARFAAEIAAWKEHYRDETDLQVVLNGDIIAGLIHLDDAGVRKLTEQIHGATCILISFLDYLVQHFGRIGVLCTPGNHCRVARERQVAQRWDSHAHAIYLAIQQAFRNEERIRFDIPATGDGVVECPGGKSLAFYTHGDVNPTIANVGRALDIKPMVATLNRLNASGEYRLPIRVVGYGHWHQAFSMPTGIGAIVVNGSVIGPDGFARNGCGIRGKEGMPMQVMFESVPGYEFGDCRFVHLREADNDPTYDKIIATPRLEQWLS